MLRLLLLVSVCLSTLFTLVGAVLSREWGWSEYASDELYLIYYQNTGYGDQTFIVNTNGENEGQPITWQNADISWIDCSPDGRTLAFLTETAQLVLMTSGSTLVQEQVRRIRGNLSVSNDGTLNLFDSETRSLQTDLTLTTIPVSTQVRQTSEFIDETEELFLSSEDYGGRVSLLSARTGRTVLSLQYATDARWLGSEQLFTFRNQEHYYVMDAQTQQSVLLAVNKHLGLVSPDGTKRVVGLDSEMQPIRFEDSPEVFQLFLADIFDENFVRLTHNDVHNFALCFLTFRPEMLIDQSS